MKKQKWLSFTLAVMLMMTFCGCGKELGMLAQHKQTEEVAGENVIAGEGMHEQKEEPAGDMGTGDSKEEIPVDVPSTQISDEQQEVIDGFTYQVPCGANWYIVEVPGGMEASYDLNGDGKEETVFYSTRQEEGFPRFVNSLLIDGKEFKDEFQVPGAREQFFGVVDLVKEDDSFELALYAQAEGGEEKTYFFRYDGEKLDRIGVVSGFIDMAAIDSGEAHLDGNGNIYSMFTLQLLADYEAPGWWQVSENGRINKVFEELYCPLAMGNNKVVVRDELKLYMERDTESEFVTVLPSDLKVSLQATDDKEWLLISVDNKTTGWINKQSLVALGVPVDS